MTEGRVMRKLKALILRVVTAVTALLSIWPSFTIFPGDARRWRS